jgi:hypothetical protein
MDWNPWISHPRKGASSYMQTSYTGLVVPGECRVWRLLRQGLDHYDSFITYRRSLVISGFSSFVYRNLCIATLDRSRVVRRSEFPEGGCLAALPRVNRVYPLRHLNFSRTKWSILINFIAAGWRETLSLHSFARGQYVSLAKPSSTYRPLASEMSNLRGKGSKAESSESWAPCAFQIRPTRS